MSSPRAVAVPRTLALVAVMALLVTACGPRFDREALVVGGGSSGGVVVDDDTGVAGGQAPAGERAGDGTPTGGASGTDGGDSGGSIAVGGSPSTGDASDGGPGSGSAGSAPGGSDTGSDGASTGGTAAGGTTAGGGTTGGGSTTGGGGSAAVTDPGNTQGITDEPCPGVDNAPAGGCITIGYLVPLTGAAPIPTSWDDGANLYWDVLNDNGGINGRGIRLLIEDTESSTTTAVQKARKLATQDKVHTILTLDRLEVQDAVARFLESVGMPHIMIQSPADPPAAWKNTFTVSIDHSLQGRAIASFWADELQAADGAKKVGFVREQTNALKPGTDAFEAEAAARGLEVVAALTIDPQSPDVSQTVLTLQQSGAEIVWLYMAPTPAARIIGQSGGQGYRPTWFANSISWGFELMHGVTGGFMDGAYAFSPWVSLSHPDTARYKQAWRDQGIDGNPDDIGLVGWGAGGIAHAAMEAAGDRPGWNTLRSGLRGLRIDTDVWVPLDFTGGGSLGTSSVAIFKAEGGAWTTVDPARRF